MCLRAKHHIACKVGADLLCAKGQLYQANIALQRLEDRRQSSLAPVIEGQDKNPQAAAACDETRQALAGCSLHGRPAIRAVVVQREQLQSWEPLQRSDELERSC